MKCLTGYKEAVNCCCLNRVISVVSGDVLVQVGASTSMCPFLERKSHLARATKTLLIKAAPHDETLDEPASCSVHD